MELRKFVLHLSAGMAGTETHEAYLVPENITPKLMEEYAAMRANEHAEMYGIYPPEDEDDSDSTSVYWEYVSGVWEPYNASKHDSMLLCGNETKVTWNHY